ncbi:MAG: DNA repair protein RecN [Thermoflavifilum sp.]|nr:DNA repair protein RecN [Thermoflavifilum sp.]
MLQRLYIKNYAIIDELEIHFSPHFTCITGETGAGKSILIDALALLLGERADPSVLADPQQKAVVEGVFVLPEEQAVRELFAAFDWDWDQQVIIRRELLPPTKGSIKSRAFVNDTPANLQQLQQLTQFLVDLHQQFDTLQLLHAGFQREVLDALCHHSDLLNSLREHFRQLQQLQHQLQTLEAQHQQALRELDYDQFLLQELQEARFQEQEIEQLEEEQRLLEHIASIRQSVDQAYQLMVSDVDEASISVLAQLRQAKHFLESAAMQHRLLQPLADRLHSVYIEIQDIADELSREMNRLVDQPERLQQVQERLSLAYRLMKKHQVQDTAGLLAQERLLENKVQQVSLSDEQIHQLQAEISALQETLAKEAAEISRNRQAAAAPFAAQVNQLLNRIGMPHARLEVSIQPTTLSETGQDDVQFLWDANQTGQFISIKQVASGGELSRLMLCIKSLVASHMRLPTLIFDEIDQGISGEAARQVGHMLAQLAEHHQIICITHQPQIASRADMHLLVFKEKISHQMVTRVKQLQDEDRVEAIARMLSGDHPTRAALENARELMSKHNR